MLCPQPPGEYAVQPFNSLLGPPEISQFTRTYSEHTELVKFEARVLIDGRMVASVHLSRFLSIVLPLCRSKVFGRNTKWPLLIETSFGMLCPFQILEPNE